MNFVEELKRRNVIRVAIAYVVGAWLLVQGADLIFNLIGADEWVLRAVASVLALGFIPVVAFAWAFEMTPEGIRKEKDVDRTHSITHHTAKKLDIVTIVLLVAVVALIAVDHMVMKPETNTGPNAGPDTISQDAPKETSSNSGEIVSGPNSTVQRSIAVLPFVDMSPAKDNEYFTDGLTEELLNILAQIKTLQVAGRTSSFAFKDKTEDLREIGEKLNVNTLLEGSVRKDDQRQKIRVTVQLINVADGYHIWSDTYDRDLEDIFAIQEDIARQVADALKINLLGEAALPIEDHARTGMNAYDLYLKGLQSLNVYTFESLREAEKQFTQSLEIDPDYQPTRLALVRTWLDLARTGALSPDKAREQAEPMIESILAEDPSNSYALTYQAMIQSLRNDFEGANKSFTQALESNPRNAQALTEFGRFLINHDRIDDGLELLQTASSIEPYDIKVQWELCVTQSYLVNVAGATRECGRIGEIQPGNPMEFYGLAWVYLFRGELTPYLKFYTKAADLDPEDPELPASMAKAWLDLDDAGQAEAELQKAAQIDPKHPSVVSARIQTLLQREQYQQAVELAQDAYDKKLPDRLGSADTIARLLVSNAVMLRDYDRALKILIEQLPDNLESPLDTVDVFDIDILASIAMVEKLQDPLSADVPALLNHADELNQRSDPHNVPSDKPFRQAMIESARGDKSAAITALKKSFDLGWRWDWHDWMYRDFVFAPLHNEPEFKQLIALLEADMEKQRVEAYQVLGLKK